MTVTADPPAPVAPARRILHVDLDAFYAAVEQRDEPRLRGQPVAVAWSEEGRSVVLTASYEARPFGVRSAMPVGKARRLCPRLVFVRPDFAKYREVSRQVRAIFRRHTDLVEPLSLDEAYLDVTRDRTGLATATAVAESIRGSIRAEVGLTASAGAAPNKFLAKIASDWRKPDGLFVIKPHQVEAFLDPLPVARLPGVGPATAERLAAWSVRTVGELRRREAAELAAGFGRYGRRLWELARGIDDRPVEPNRPTRSISCETTFDRDLGLDAIEPIVLGQAAAVWRTAAANGHRPRTLVVKLKTPRFQVLTRRVTPARPPASEAEAARLAASLLARFETGAADRRRPPEAPTFRLCGVGLANFLDDGPDGAAGGDPASAETASPSSPAGGDQAPLFASPHPLGTRGS